MSNRSLIGALAALGLLGVLCVCALGAFLVVGSGGLAPIQSAFSGQPDSGTAPAPQVGATATRVPAQPLALPSESLAVVRAEEEVVASVYEMVIPSVVNVSISGESNSLFGDLGQGSGWVWDADGHIVTNNHVVTNAQTVIVTFHDGTQRTAEVIGTDTNSDLAVIRVNDLPENARPLVPGNSADLRVGQRVIAIGNPFGFEGTLTLGVVSATQRAVPLTTQPTESGGFYNISNLIQTDAAINPGNSGGPLLDVEGRVVGVNSMIYSQVGTNSGVGFAIPVDKVKAVVPQLISTGSFETPYLGVSSQIQSLTPELADALGLQNVTRGVLVTEVVPGGPADQAGLRGSDEPVTLPGGASALTGGDVITAIDDRQVSDFDDLVNYLDTRAVGDQVTLTIVRDGETMQLPLTLGARP